MFNQGQGGHSFLVPSEGILLQQTIKEFRSIWSSERFVDSSEIGYTMDIFLILYAYNLQFFFQKTKWIETIQKSMYRISFPYKPLIGSACFGILKILHHFQLIERILKIKSKLFGISYKIITVENSPLSTYSPCRISFWCSW